MSEMQIDGTVDLIRTEYAELPGLKLTFWQAQRLWSLSSEQCEWVLKALTESQFLARTADGAYVRRDVALPS